MYPLAETYAKGLQSNDQIKWFIQEKWIQVEVLRMVYHTKVNEKELTPLENLPESEKNRIKAIVKQWGTGDVDNRMKQAKAIYLIEQLQLKKIEL